MKRISPLTLRYAKAIFGMTLQLKNYDAVYSEISAFRDMLSSNQDIKKVLLNPTLPIPVKNTALNSLLKHINFSELTGRILFFLLKRKRLPIINELPDALNLLIKDYKGIVEIEIITALPASNIIKEQWTQRLQKILNKKVELSIKEDKTQLGGIEVRIGDRSLDGTCRGKLEKLRYLLLTA